MVLHSLDMALNPVMRLRLLANPHTLRPSHLTKRRINSQSTHIHSDKKTTIIYPCEKVNLCQMHQKKDTCVPRAKKQFVRKHGTTSNLVNESDRNLDYCFKKIRQYEFENFLCTLLLPEEARRGAIAVRAFNIEIAQVPPSVYLSYVKMVQDHDIWIVRPSVYLSYVKNGP